MSVPKPLRRKDTNLVGGNPGRFAPGCPPDDAQLDDRLTLLSQVPSPAVALPPIFDSLTARFSRQGKSLYVVGGLVRDSLLGLSANADTDVDLTTDATPDEIHAALEGWADTVWDLGEKFGTVAAGKSGYEVEITTFRSETYDPDSRKPEVEFSTSLHDDLERRDFTFNAMAMDTTSGQLIDPHNGAADLRNRVLRTPSSADRIFTDDPLRMLRAARFVARFGMTPHPDVLASMERHRERIGIVSGERVSREVIKLLSLPQPEAGLKLLRDTGLYPLVLGDTNAEDERLATAFPAANEPHIRLALLFGSADSPDQLRSLMRRWHSSRADEEDVLSIWRVAQEAVRSSPDDVPALRRMVLAAKDSLDSGLRAAEAMGASDRLRESIVRLKARESDLGQPVLTGTEIMETLEVSPGPTVGQAQRFLNNLRIEAGPLTTSEAKKRLTEWHTQAT